MSKAKMILSTAALLGFSGIVACSHSNRRSEVDASASAPAATTPPSIASGTTTEADTTTTAPTDLGASTSGRGL